MKHVLHSTVKVLGVLAESMETGDKIKSCQLQNAVFCKESFVFTCLTYQNVQLFWNMSVHKFYGLKASQMSKVHASSHEYWHIQKIKKSL